MEVKTKISLQKLPKHIAIIMDGNGRWAKQKGRIRIFGHKSAVVAVRETVEAAAEIGIKFLTLYAFSTENWKRPQREVDALMELLVTTISKERETFKKNNIRLTTIGDIQSLPKNCYKELLGAMEYTKDNSRMTLVLALNYSSKWEIIKATKQLAQAVQDNKIKVDDINETLFASHLSTHFIPDPELLIRTSGEYRISNFLLWQIAYSELFFTQKLWPDFRKNDLYEAILDYQNRERRFGMTSEQLKKK